MHQGRRVEIAPFSLVVLVGASGSGKSTLAARHFPRTAVVSSDRLREMLADDASDQSVSAAAFEILHLIVARRLATGRLTVVDATSTTAAARAPLVRLAREAGASPVALVLDVGLDRCLANDASRRRRVVPEVIAAQLEQLAASLPTIDAEGFDLIVRLDVDEIETVAFSFRDAPTAPETASR